MGLPAYQFLEGQLPNCSSESESRYTYLNLLFIFLAEDSSSMMGDYRKKERQPSRQ